MRRQKRRTIRKKMKRTPPERQRTALRKRNSSPPSHRSFPASSLRPVRPTSAGWPSETFALRSPYWFRKRRPPFREDSPAESGPPASVGPPRPALRGAACRAGKPGPEAAQAEPEPAGSAPSFLSLCAFILPSGDHVSPLSSAILHPSWSVFPKHLPDRSGNSIPPRNEIVKSLLHYLYNFRSPPWKIRKKIHRILLDS